MEEFVEATDALIELGSSSQDYVPEMLKDADHAWRILLCGNGPWMALGQRLKKLDLANLIRGLVAYGRVTGRSTGGSVSPIIPLYYAFAERFPKDEPDLTRWIVSNRTNEYDPFGSTICNRESSLEDYRRARGARAEVAIANETRDLARQAEDKERKRIKDAENATSNLCNAVRRGDLAAVKALLQKGADVSRAMPNGSLVALALEYGRTAVAEFLREHGIR